MSQQSRNGVIQQAVLGIIELDAHVLAMLGTLAKTAMAASAVVSG